MSIKETDVTAKLIKSLRDDFYAMVLNLHGHAMQSAGWPDMYVSHWKFRGWIECKGPKTPLKPLQIKIMRELIKRGDHAYVLRFETKNGWCLNNCDESERLKQFSITNPKDGALQLLAFFKELTDGTGTH